MSNDKLKLVVSNKGAKPEEPSTESSPQSKRFQNFLMGVFYFLWIASIPSVFAISCAIALGTFDLTIKAAYSIVGPIALVFVVGIALFVVMQTRTSNHE